MFLAKMGRRLEYKNKFKWVHYYRNKKVQRSWTNKPRSRDCSVSLVTRLRVGCAGFNFPFGTASSPVLGLIHSPIQQVPGLFLRR